VVVTGVRRGELRGMQIRDIDLNRGLVHVAFDYIKGGRHYTASQLLAGGFDLRNTAARLGHSGGGATTLRHYAALVPEVDRRAAAYLAQLTARSTPSSPQP
jgi:integrase